MYLKSNVRRFTLFTLRDTERLDFFCLHVISGLLAKYSIVQNRSVVVCLTCSLVVIFLKCLCQPIKGF